MILVEKDRKKKKQTAGKGELFFGSLSGVFTPTSCISIDRKIPGELSVTKFKEVLSIVGRVVAKYLRRSCVDSNLWVLKNVFQHKLKQIPGTFGALLEIHAIIIDNTYFLSQLMVNQWFGARWFGFLGSPYERDCYETGTPRIPNHQSFASLKPLVPEMWRQNSQVATCVSWCIMCHVMKITLFQEQLTFTNSSKLIMSCKC